MAYQPAGSLTTSASLTHLATVYYNRVALDQLLAMLRFREVCEPDSIPLRSGKTVQWFRYTPDAANTVPSAEGTVGTPVPQTTTTVSATVAEYSDFSSLSTLLVETAIDPIVENFSKQLSYRAALSVDTIARTEFDSVNSSATDLNTLGATASVGDFRRVGALFGGANIRMGPRMSTEYKGIMHPYITYDLVSDNTAGGFIDCMKYSNGTQLLAGEVGKVGNFRLMETTNVATSGTAPNVLYYAYLVGQGAVGAVDLPGAGPSNVVDPQKQSFKINVVKGGPNPADPEGMIGSYVSYRFVTVHKILDSTNYRFRRLKCDASIV